MISKTLPSVLQADRGSLSVERALKQIVHLLMQLPGNALDDTGSPMDDQILASVDDIETMLAAIDRS